jgi:hypothetical protein
MFASSSRLDLSITVGPQKPSHIKTILSSPLPIFIEYKRLYGDITGSTLWRMNAALKHRNRVREITFGGAGVVFEKFIRATNYHFPALESLELCPPFGHDLDIPASFLRGPDQSDLRLRRLTLYDTSLASVSGLLSSATVLTDLNLDVSSDATVIDSSQGSFFLACLQGMQSLRSLHLTTPDGFRDSHSTPKDIVPLLKLTHFHYDGSISFLNDLMSGLSAPSLQDARFEFYIEFPFLHYSRLIDDVREEFRSVGVTFDVGEFRLSSWTNLGKIDRFEPSFTFDLFFLPVSNKPIINNSTPSIKLSMAEELALFFPRSNITDLETIYPLREFLRQFRSVRVLRLDPFIREVGLYLQQDDGEAILPLLEEIELSISHLKRCSYKDFKRRTAEELAAFEPFVSARERAGRLVKVYHSEQI